SSGSCRSSASASTRALKSSQESSRLRNRSAGSSSRGWGCASAMSGPATGQCYSRIGASCPGQRSRKRGVTSGREMSTDPRFAEPTPFARLVYAQATGACGDACILVSMAGSIFFSSPTSAARGKVLLFLLITMAPFAVIAPVLGPALDRSKGGRRLLMILSATGRALICFVMAMYISKPAPEGLLVYPLAFGMLVLGKGAQIAKSALVPA